MQALENLECWREGDAGVSRCADRRRNLEGIFITLCGYTDEAKQLAEKHGIEIVSEVRLAKMIEDIGVQSDPEMIAILNDSRKYCPKCEREMVLRTTRKGTNAGGKFWGCSTYPKCRFTMPV